MNVILLFLNWKIFIPLSQSPLSKYIDLPLLWPFNLCLGLRVSPSLPHSVSPFLYPTLTYPTPSLPLLLTPVGRLNISAENDCRRLHCSLRDLSSLLQAVGRLSEYFIGDVFASRFNDAVAVVERSVVCPVRFSGRLRPSVADTGFKNPKRGHRCKTHVCTHGVKSSPNGMYYNFLLSDIERWISNLSWAFYTWWLNSDFIHNH